MLLAIVYLSFTSWRKQACGVGTEASRSVIHSSSDFLFAFYFPIALNSMLIPIIDLDIVKLSKPVIAGIWMIDVAFLRICFAEAGMIEYSNLIYKSYFLCDKCKFFLFSIYAAAGFGRLCRDQIYMNGKGEYVNGKCFSMQIRLEYLVCFEFCIKFVCRSSPKSELFLFILLHLFTTVAQSVHFCCHFLSLV